MEERISLAPAAQPPPRETRRAAACLHLDVPDDDVEASACHSPSCSRQLDSPLGRAQAHLPLAVGALSTLVLTIGLVATMWLTLAHYVVAAGSSLLSWASFALHPALMTLAFGLLAPIGSVAYRTLEMLLGVSHGTAKRVHASLMGSAGVFGVLGLVDMWVVHERAAEEAKAAGLSVHFQSVHGLVGIGALALLSANGLVGFGAFCFPSARPALRRAVLPAHSFAGTLGVVLGLIAIVTGILSLAGRGDNAAPKDRLFKSAAVLAMLLLGHVLGLVVVTGRAMIRRT